MKPTYDSGPETQAHIARVQELMQLVVANVAKRRLEHDRSKLVDPEKAEFDRLTTRLKDSTYGSDEYKGFLKELKVALDHHYEHNTHHPEHYANGINGMSLLDLIEMLCDWKAAGERHANGSLAKSLEINQARFKIDPQLQQILQNTAKELGLL
jgi:hypothetical protein